MSHLFGNKQLLSNLMIGSLAYLPAMQLFFKNALLRFGLSNNKRHRNSQLKAAEGYNLLENRRVLASIFLSSSGELFISGGGGNDVGALVTSGDQVEASITGTGSQTFAASEVQSVTFIGNNGNDTLTNFTDIRSSFFGGNGNDRLIGGSNNDFIDGGSGADIIFGNEGDDELVGSLGNDVLRGGVGNDTLFGSADENRIFGGDGDDILFGGDQVDRIFGGSGIDQIFGLDGDDFLYTGDGGVAGTVGIGQADLILGLGGNDTIIAGAGLNVLWGGDGNDIITGGDSAENRLHGQSGNDTLTGGDGFDFIRGLQGVNIINGGGGGDFIIAGAGDEGFDGGAGIDTVRFTGNYSNFRINENTANVLTVRDLRSTGAQGDNDTKNVETFEFADQSRAAAISSVQQVVVRPIVVSDDNGRNTAAFFGDAESQAEIEELIDDIFAQANIDVVWQDAVTVRNSFINTGNGSGTRATNDLRTIVSTGDRIGVGSTNASVIDAYFVERVPGFRDVGETSANGLAFVGEGGTAIHVGDALLELDFARRIVAGVVAHELGHNLGLHHVEAASNLLNSGRTVASDRSNFLTANQIETILDSSLTTNIGSTETTVSVSGNGVSTGAAGLVVTVTESGSTVIEEFELDYDEDDHGLGEKDHDEVDHDHF